MKEKRLLWSVRLGAKAQYGGCVQWMLWVGGYHLGSSECIWVSKQVGYKRKRMWSSGSEWARQSFSYSFQCLLLLWKIGSRTLNLLIQSLVQSQISLHQGCWLSRSKKESVYKCATLIITIECWSKNSMKRGVRLSKKPLKSSTSRSRDLRSTGRASVQYVPIDTRFGNDLLQSLLWLWKGKEICTRLKLVLCFQHQGIREHLLDMQTREWAIRVLFYLEITIRSKLCHRKRAFVGYVILKIKRECRLSDP